MASLSGSLAPSALEMRFAPLLADAAGVRRHYRLIWIGCGSEDIFLGGARDFAARLQRANIPHVFREFSGPHSLPVARTQLAELLPLLFRESRTRP